MGAATVPLERIAIIPARPQGPILTPADAWRALNRRQRRFVAHYLSVPSAAEAARRAGYSAKGAKTQGHRLLAMPEIRAALRVDGSQGARLLAVSYMPDIIDDTAKDARDRSLSTLDNIRAGRLLLEFAGFLKSRGGRRA